MENIFHGPARIFIYNSLQNMAPGSFDSKWLKYFWLYFVALLSATYILISCCSSINTIYLDKLECAIFIIDHYPVYRLPIDPMVPISGVPPCNLMFFVISRNYLNRNLIFPNKQFHLEVIDAVGHPVDTSIATIEPNNLTTNEFGVSAPVVFKSNLVGIYRIKATYTDKFLDAFTIGAPIIISHQ